MNEIYEELLNHLVEEKLDYNDYKELAEKTNDESLKGMLETIANQEHDHYLMIKRYLANKMQ
jgi:rubrerythrin